MRYWASRGVTGVVASVSASALYGVLFFLPPALDPLSPSAIYGWRVLLTVVALGLGFALAGRGLSLSRAFKVITSSPRRAVATVVNATILGLQLWLFGWGPATGHGLDVALGYLLLPIVMMLTGVAMFHDRLGRLRWAALLLAAAGTTVGVVLAGGVSLATVAVAVGYPVYFTLRRLSGLESVGVLWWEIALTVPVAVALTINSGSWTTIAYAPSLWGSLVLLGVVSAAALGSYMLASSRLTFTVFGILSYAEPILLVLVSVLALGEPLVPQDLGTYIPIAAALVLLSLDARSRSAHP